MSVFDLAREELHRGEIIERLERLRGDLELTVEAIRRAEADLYRLEGRIALMREMGAESPQKQRRKRTNVVRPDNPVTNPSRSAVTDAALMAIADRGRPLTRAELYEEMSARGIKIQGKDALMVFSTMLWRERKRIVRLRGFGYWPADKPYPPAGYDPSGAQPSLL